MKILTLAQTSNVTNSSNTTPSDVTGMSFTVYNGRTYYFKIMLVFQTVATTTGVGFTFTSPAVSLANWGVLIRQAAVGASMYYENSAVAMTTVLVNASVVAANTDYDAVIEGVFVPSADGTVQLRCRSEVNASQVTVKNALGVVIHDVEWGSKSAIQG